MQVLICAAGSYGDVLPFIAIARELQRRGLSVRVYTSAYFQPLLRHAGVEHVPIGSAQEFLTALRNPDTNHPTRSLRVFAYYARKFSRSAYEAMAPDIEPGNTIIVGSCLAFTARFVAETHRVPVVTVHLSPSAFRSVHQMARFGPNRLPIGAPRCVKRLVWWLADTLVVDPTLGAALNRCRAEVGLRPIRRYLHDWLHQADAVVGMFPEWFADRQPDWPSNLTLTGFPLYDQGNEWPMPREVEAFLAKGPAPVCFTAGTGSAATKEFFAESIEACNRSGRRAVLLTEHADQVPDWLPANIIRSGYIPFSKLLPRLAAFVHHGGIGTTSQAMRAGVPQVIRPMAHDQFDNCDRATRLGVALELLPKAYKVNKILAALDRIETDAATRAACRKVASLFHGNPVGETCDAILRVTDPGMTQRRF